MRPLPKTDQRSLYENRLLAAVGAQEHLRLRPILETTYLDYKTILHEPGAPIDYVYFPADAIVSLLSLAEENTGVEVGMVGSEGMVGAPVLLSGTTTPFQAIVQSPGLASRAPAEAFKKAFQRSRVLKELLLPYARTLLTQSTQSAACHCFHTPMERLCRWLLMVHDRTTADQFNATQEFISEMLGTRRATITEAAHLLQQQGIIEYRRGHVHVRERKQLETLACRCYHVIREGYDNLDRLPQFPSSPRATPTHTA